MFRTKYIKSLIIATAAAAAFAAACTKDPVYPDSDGTDSAEGGEPASLTLNISIADVGIGVSTRTGTGTDEGTDEGTGTGTGTPGTPCGSFDKADLLNPDNPWPELNFEDTGKTPDEFGRTLTEKEYKENYRVTEAALVDGSMMTCLTVILINYHDNKIVAVRRIPDPNCPNHDVQYLQGTQSYPPTDADEIAKAKKNCILLKKKDGSVILAPVLRDEEGKVIEDDKDHILGLVGTHACVTLDYNEPIHRVTEAMVENDASKQSLVGQSAEKLVRGEYTLLVIANYDHRVTTASEIDPDGVGFPTLNVDKTLENLADEFHKPDNMANGIPDFKPKYEYLYNLRFLMNRTLEKKGQTQVDGHTTDIYNVENLPNGADGKPLKPYIRPAVHQTLTAAKEIYLAAGDNVVNIELQRIASRTRVEVKNYADDIPLKVHSLVFSPNYTQSTNYLFRRNKNNRDYSELATSVKNASTRPPYGDHDGKGAPMVDYTGFYNMIDGKPTYGAIVPFIKDWDFDEDKVNDGVIVAAKSKKCIFDALMYESSLDYKDENHDPADPDSFTYTIDVSYPGINNYETPDLNKIDYEKWVKDGKKTVTDPDKATFEYATADKKKAPLSIPDSADKLYDAIKKMEEGLDATKSESLCFFIQSMNKGDNVNNEYLNEKDVEDAQVNGTICADRADRTKPVELTTDGIDVKSYLWVLDGLAKDDDGNYTCYLKNLRSGRHLPAIPKGVTPTEASHMKSTDDTTSPKYILGVSNTDNSEYCVTFANHYDVPYYLNVWWNSPYLSGWTGADRGSQFKLYPVKISYGEVHYIGTPRIKKEVTLTAFSDETAVVEKVREIKRNDFVRILVEVSYTPEDGEFKFRVKPWDKRTGAVDFN